MKGRKEDRKEIWAWWGGRRGVLTGEEEAGGEAGERKMGLDE